MTTEQKLIEGWTILELMGHRRLAGYVNEVEIAGQGFLRLEIPAAEIDGDELPAVTQFYSPSAVYALTPTTEELARQVRSRPQPVHAFEIPRPLALNPASSDHDDHTEDDDLGF